MRYLVAGFLVVGMGCEPDPLTLAGNRAPQLSALLAAPPDVRAGHHTRIEATLHDPDGMPPELKWELPDGEAGGDLIIQGSTALWRAPDDPGEYRVRLTLTDAEDSEMGVSGETTLEVYGAQDDRWDGADHPSVETPVGDFFGMGHAATRNFVSAPLQMSPQGGRAFNCFFPMPFAAGARIEFENQGEFDVTALYYYVDYEELDELPEDVGRFHAFWNRENPCDGIDYSEYDNSVHQGGGRNPSADGNYLILDTSGAGHYVGCHLDIENLRDTDDHNWYGEGDDMIFIDGEPFPPSLHGTGTEDFFNTAWCPNERYDSPYHGIILPGGDNWSGHISLYRYHIEDPVVFKESIKVTIEHGHANYRSDDYSSTAYWYQTEPRALSRPLPPVDQRLPRTPVDMSLQLS